MPIAVPLTQARPGAPVYADIPLDDAPAPSDGRAAGVLCHLRQQHTVDGYTSWPAYADALEHLVARLLSPGGAA